MKFLCINIKNKIFFVHLKRCTILLYHKPIVFVEMWYNINERLFMFDLDFDFDFGENVVIETNKKKHTKLQKIDVSSKIVKKIEDDNVVRFISQSDYNCIDFIRAIFDNFDVEECYFLTFRIGKKEFDYLKEVYEDEELKKMLIVISKMQQRNDLANEQKHNSKKYNNYEYILKSSKETGIELLTYDTHLKVYLFKTKNEYLVLESSANLNRNNESEFYTFYNDKITYDYFLKWINENVEKD